MKKLFLSIIALLLLVGCGSSGINLSSKGVQTVYFLSTDDSSDSAYAVYMDDTVLMTIGWYSEVSNYSITNDILTLSNDSGDSQDLRLVEDEYNGFDVFNLETDEKEYHMSNQNRACKFDEISLSDLPATYQSFTMITTDGGNNLFNFKEDTIFLNSGVTLELPFEIVDNQLVVDNEYTYSYKHFSQFNFMFENVNDPSDMFFLLALVPAFGENC